jgi:hypothetical protein
MMAPDRTKILFSTDRAADSGSMLIRSRPSQPRVNPAYLRETIGILPRGGPQRGIERHWVEFIERERRRSPECGATKAAPEEELDQIRVGAFPARSQFTA